MGTAAVEECGNELIGDCYSEEDVINMKDHQLRNVLEVLEKSVEEWDTDKCEAVKAHVERVKELQEGGDDDFDNDGIINDLDYDDDNDGIEDDEDEDDDNDGIIDTEDKDDDNDGVPDREDNQYEEEDSYDGIPNDEDDDNDGIPDDEDNGDSDGDGDGDDDGVPDDEDSDDDNDGIPDDEDYDNDDEEGDTEEESGDGSEESSANVAGLSLALCAIVLGRTRQTLDQTRSLLIMYARRLKK